MTVSLHQVRPSLPAMCCQQDLAGARLSSPVKARHAANVVADAILNLSPMLNPTPEPLCR